MFKTTKTPPVTGGMKPTTILGIPPVSLGFPQYGQIQFGRQQEDRGGALKYERSVRRTGLYLNGSFLTFNQRCQTYNTKKIFFFKLQLKHLILSKHIQHHYPTSHSVRKPHWSVGGMETGYPGKQETTAHLKCHKQSRENLRYSRLMLETSRRKRLLHSVCVRSTLKKHCKTLKYS